MELQYSLQITGSINVTSSPAESHLSVHDDENGTREIMLEPNQQIIINEAILDAVFGRRNPPANPNTGVGTFTYKVHMDLNGNGLQDLDEPDGNIPAGTLLVIASRAGLPVITIDLSGTGPTAGRVDRYSLPVGDYDMHVTLPAGYRTLGVPDQVIHITADNDVNMGFLGLIVA